MQHYNKYKEEKKRVKYKLHQEKKTYYHDKFKESKGDAARVWSTIRGVVLNNKSHNVITDEDVNHTAEFNNLFCCVGREIFEKLKNDSTNIFTASDNVKSLRCIDNLITHNLFKPKPIDIEVVILTIAKLKETKSVGCDGISLWFMKDSLFVTAFYLTCIINTSIVTGKFPAPGNMRQLFRFLKEGIIVHPPITDPYLSSLYYQRSQKKIVAKQPSDHLEETALLTLQSLNMDSGLTYLLKLLSQ